MNCRFLFVICAVAVPLAAGYGAASGNGGSYSSSGGYGSAAGGSGSLDELVQAATGGSQQAAASLTANAEVQPSQAEAARLNQVSAQLQALNSNPSYQNLKNSEAIADSLAESNLASNIRQGNINVVAPNVVDQGVFRSLLVPSGQNNHHVIATQPLPPIIVNQPASPPAHVNSGPPSVIKAAPVIYKIRPSVIYQQEVINKVPTPLSLNPVYVKVYKPGKKIDAPTAPAVQPVYQQSGSSYGSGGQNGGAGDNSYSNGGGNSPVYGSSSGY